MIKTFPPLKLRQSEILRYAGVKEKSEDMLKLASEMEEKINSLVKNKAVYEFFEVRTEDDCVYLQDRVIRSKDLAKNLKNCKTVMLTAVTLGIEVDRAIAIESALSPSRAVMLDACGVEAVERLCDELIAVVESEENIKLKARFSAGYGDLKIEEQAEIFKLLDCGRKIGLYLNDSMLMSPSKSVTAFVGVEERNDT